MSNSDRAIDQVLAKEGGFVNDLVDHGGATNYGITLRVWRAWRKDNNLSAEDLRAIKPEEAHAFYADLWMKSGMDRINSLLVSSKLFDMIVNMGQLQAVKNTQRACRALDFDLLDDGTLGPKTLSAINSADPFLLVAAMRSEAAGFYRVLCAKHPDQEKFKAGWLNRAYS